MAPPSRKSQDGSKFNKHSKKPFKSKKKTSEIAQAETISLQIEDDVPDFPRGGGGYLSQKKGDKVRAQGDKEFQNDNLKTTTKRGKMRRKHPSNGDDLESLLNNGVVGNLPKYANKITLKNINPRMKFWGVVAEVNKKDLVISLPRGLRGLVSAADAFDPILEKEIEDPEHNLLPVMFHVGQLVPCVVLQVDDDKKESGKRKIWLSLRLSILYKDFTLDLLQEGMVLTSYVKSIEDHGYILHFGLTSFTGFLPKTKQSDQPGNEVQVGQLLQCVVRSIDKTRKVVYFSSDQDIVSSSVAKDLKGISIDLLIPGMMVSARVQSTLENGILLSFLTYFNGTVDMFHLQNSFHSSNWKDYYNQNMKVNARILFIDPSTRAVGLTLIPHLIHNKAAPPHVRIGDIYDSAKVVRVDRGSGLLLEVTSSPESTPTFVSVSDMAEEVVKKIGKKFKEGSHVRVRILGFRHLEGLAIGTLKASAFEGPVFSYSDVKPGTLIRAKVIVVDDFGAIVQFPGGLKALCPLSHMSEFEIAKPRKKFKVGAELIFRVLGCKSKRITVTHKKTLVKSKLEVLSSYADATAGLVAHGWITKIEKHGCFVRFYNGVQGFAPRFELGIEPGSDPSSTYHIGQVIKCRITSSTPSSKRISLSFVMKPARVSEDTKVELGHIVTGVVDEITETHVTLYVNRSGYSRGRISMEHLSDHQAHASSMKSVLKPGYQFDQLLVLDIEGQNLILSAKQSLINLAHVLPSDPSQVKQYSVIHGFISNIIERGCFVRFLGRLTGFSPRNKAMEDRKLDLQEAFYIGQSVRSSVVDVSGETGRITLSLKQSTCFSTDASFIQEFFLTEEKIAKLQSLDESNWAEEFSIGSVVEGEVQEVKDIGVTISFEKYHDVFGFIALHGLSGSIVETGSTIQAAVLDVSKTERLVDLSLKPEIVDNWMANNSSRQTSRKKRKAEALKDLEMNQTVHAVVEAVKENYLVLSLPEFGYAIGYASTYDYNTQRLHQKQFTIGQSVVASVVALPCPSTFGRLLLLLKSISEGIVTPGSKRSKKNSSREVGSLVHAEIIDIQPLEMRLKFGTGLRGRVHVTEVSNMLDETSEAPFSNFRVGQTVVARIVAEANHSANKKKGCLWELSVKPDVLKDFSVVGGVIANEDLGFSIGQRINAYVSNVNGDWAWLAVTRQVTAQLFILDSSSEPSELQEFSKRYYVGRAVSGYISNINGEKKILRLVLHHLSGTSTGEGDQENLKISNLQTDVSKKHTCHFNEGEIVGGRISKILPGVGGLLVQIGPQLFGRVHYTELTDCLVPDPLSGYKEGQFVKCKVIEITHAVKGTIHIDLSLRSSAGILCQKNVECSNHENIASGRVRIEDIHSHMEVQGYVKNVSPKGCFILLSRGLEAKILLSNLSDGYIDNPEKEFPVGKLVRGRILSVEPLSKRVEVTLKSVTESGALRESNDDLRSFSAGDMISGRIKRVESFGLFISIDNTDVVGLCHVSEVSDDPIENLESRYHAGDMVKAKVLKVDEKRHRIALGMKRSYIGETSEIRTNLEEEHEDATDGDDFIGDTRLSMDLDSNSTKFKDMDDFDNIEPEQPLRLAESRAFVPPLEVTLDDIDETDIVTLRSENKELTSGTDSREKNDRREKKKAKEEREMEVRAAEERLLQNNLPTTVDEFEKLVRSSPNSSFVWIKYMAFVLSMADIEKARAIAERALRTINIREENEKLNIWLAYFNLENEYGNPKEDAVTKIFQRALQCNDPKKVHLALLGMYERTEQLKLADELLDKMIKRFKHSCKVWLRRMQSLLKNGQVEIQSILNRALLCLPKRKHIKFISQTAILEFKCGVADRGRSMFEGILREYPKRTDLWSIYLDQEIRLGDADMIRALFERATSLSLAPKKMKFLFKKYLEYEKSVGDKERIESVKQKALEYVESTLA
ncbi:rRNA biogenesis protein RRP5 isoform X2 [Benincasa hispida]|uniref:rRNA biogenesis protein RRP5 isoform X2 n=1 Tax=Benincasa hispida TaxID=102211 RepID=UPI00190252B0|nr:rRNA biogenesis protein RRP5 isoform X2 [Benincasa hispida]